MELKLLTTEPLPADVGRIGDMFFQVLKYDVFRNGTVGGREIPTASKAPAPVSAPQLRKLALDLMGGPPLHHTHQVTYRQFRRNRNEQKDMTGGQHTPDDINALFATDMTADVTYLQSNIARQNLLAILLRPDDVIAVIVNAVLAFGILNSSA